MTTSTYSDSNSKLFGPVGLTANDKIDICRGVFAFLVVAAHSVDIAWSIHPDAPAALSMVAASVFALRRRRRRVLGHRLLRHQRLLHSAFRETGHRGRIVSSGGLPGGTFDAHPATLLSGAGVRRGGRVAHRRRSTALLVQRC